MKKLTFVFIFALLASLTLSAQRDETVLSKTSLRITGAWGGPTLGITNFEGESATVAGGYGGIEFNKEFFVGWGGATIDLPTLDDNFSNPDFDYNGLVLGYTPAAHKVIHPSFLVLAGTGKASFNSIDDRAWVIQPAVGGEINVLRWFRIGATGGYRYVTGSELTILNDENLSGFFGELKFKFGFSWGKSDKYKSRNKDTDV